MEQRDLRIILPRSSDHILIKRNRIKLKAAQMLSFFQKKMHSSTSTIATLDYAIVRNQEIIKTVEQKSNSFTRNYYNSAAWNAILSNSLGAAAFGDGSLYMKRYNAAAVAFQPAYPGTWSAEGAAADAATGILVGTNATAESIEDYAMNTLVAEGNGAGQLNYSTTIGWMSWNGTTKVSTSHHQRFFANNGPSDVIVRECGLVKTLHTASTATYSTFLLIRDVLGTPATIAPGEGLLITYNLGSTYPS
jgi:hypothetical protein